MEDFCSTTTSGSSLENAVKRLEITAQHLSVEESLTTEDCSTTAPINPIKPPAKQMWNNAALAHILEHHHHDFRKKLRDILGKDPVFNMDNHDLNMKESRERTFKQMKQLFSYKTISIADAKKDPGKFLAFCEVNPLFDSSFGVKVGVHMVLFGGAIMHLGTKKHHEKYVPLIDSLSLPGSFGMTELGHGSNVQGIETTAHYDKKTDEFVINTPTDSAQKYWIGNAAMHGQACAVFAQLYVDGVHHGVHVFIVPIRNPDGTISENVRIKDNGHKMGLLGVDNGRIWFDNKRIPRDNLLNKFGEVNAEGKYVSNINDNIKRFAAMVAPLVGGRVSIAAGALNGSKISLYVAVKYAQQRRQFGKVGQEQVIMTYLTHQRRLFTGIASVYVLNFGVNFLKDKYCKPDPTSADKKEVHLLAAGLKAVTTWARTRIVQDCRECCGGQGFSSENRIGGIKADFDIDLTYEGDNTVLLQQVSRTLLVEYQKGRIPEEKSVADTPVSQVRSLSFLLGAMKWREYYLIQELASRITGDISSGMKQLPAFYKHLDIVTALGKAYVHKICLERAVAVLQSAPQELKAAIERVSILYGLWEIEQDLGTFVAFNGISHEMADAVLKEVNSVCREMYDYCDAYVDSFGLPDWAIRAPIAKDYLAYNAYAHPKNHVPSKTNYN